VVHHLAARGALDCQRSVVRGASLDAAGYRIRQSATRRSRVDRSGCSSGRWR